MSVAWCISPAVIPEHLWKGEKGWRVTAVAPARRQGDVWAALAMWGPCGPTEPDQPGYTYTGHGLTEAEARSAALARAAADPQWKTIARD